MPERRPMDAAGALMLIGFALLLGLNQVLIKVGNGGFQPMFFATLRSIGAVICLMAWMRFTGKPVRFRRRYLGPGLMIGLAFSFEFIFLFNALDHTSVTRSTVIFYTMPLWLAPIAHFMFPGERLTPIKIAGLLIAFAGVVWALVERPDGGDSSFLGDFLALMATFGWVGIVVVARGTRLSEEAPEMQLIWQLTVSIPVLFIASQFFGPYFRDPEMIHYVSLITQIVLIVAFGFAFWLWLLTIYPAADVAAFSFLTPIFGFLLGWLLLGEEIGWSLVGSLILVSLGLLLINWPKKRVQVPQKV